MFICVCVRGCVLRGMFMRRYSYICIYAYMRMCVYAYMRASMGMRAYIYIYIYIYTSYTYTYTHSHTHTHTYMHPYTYTYTYTVKRFINGPTPLMRPPRGLLMRPPAPYAAPWGGSLCGPIPQLMMVSQI